jgi:hypothetical protein
MTRRTDSAADGTGIARKAAGGGVQSTHLPPCRSAVVDNGRPGPDRGWSWRGRRRRTGWSSTGWPRPERLSSWPPARKRPQRSGRDVGGTPGWSTTERRVSATLIVEGQGLPSHAHRPLRTGTSAPRVSVSSSRRPTTALSESPPRRSTRRPGMVTRSALIDRLSAADSPGVISVVVAALGHRALASGMTRRAGAAAARAGRDSQRPTAYGITWTG